MTAIKFLIVTLFLVVSSIGRCESVGSPALTDLNAKQNDAQAVAKSSGTADVVEDSFLSKLHLFPRSLMANLKHKSNLIKRHELLTAAEITKLAAPYRLSDNGHFVTTQDAAKKLQASYLNFQISPTSTCQSPAAPVEVVSIQIGVCHPVDLAGGPGDNPFHSYMIVGGDPLGKKAAYILFAAGFDCDFSIQLGIGGPLALPGLSFVLGFDEYSCFGEPDYEEYTIITTVTSVPPSLSGLWVMDSVFTASADCALGVKAKSPIYFYAVKPDLCTDRAQFKRPASIKSTCNGDNTVVSREYFNEFKCPIAKLLPDLNRDLSPTDLCPAISAADVGLQFQNIGFISVACVNDFIPLALPVTGEPGPGPAKKVKAKKASKQSRRI